MLLRIFILVIACSQFLLSQEKFLDKKISVTFEGLELYKALSIIQDVSNINFAFNNNLDGMNIKVTGEFENTSIKEVLNILLSSKPIEYKFIGDQLIFYNKERGNDDDSNQSRINGKVIDGKTLLPLPMINITVMGITKGTVSDFNGDFFLEKIPSGEYDIRISSVGYSTVLLKKMKVNPENSMNIGTVKLFETEIALDEIVVTPGAFSIMGSEPLSRQTLNKENLKNMSYSEDITRAVSRLPGVSSNDFSSKFTVRGGETDEVLIILDGMELFDPFHQRDFSGGLFSIVDIETISGVDLYTGGFSAEYGNRQSGVFNMKTNDIESDRSSSVGLSVINARLYTEGKLADDKISYMVSARRGMLDQTLKLIDETENIPIYYDVLGKFEYKLNNKHTLSIHGLQAADKTEVRDVAEGEIDYDIHDTWYNNTYSWITLKSIYTPNLFSRSMIYGGHITHYRNGSAYKVGYSDKVNFRLRDKRKLDFFGFKNDLSWSADDNFLIKAGVDFRQLYSHYRYYIDLTDVRVNPSGIVENYSESREISQDPDGNQFSAYLSSRFSLANNIYLEPGIRFDNTSYTNEKQWSPRVSVAYKISNRTFLRAAWGYYYQSQFIYNKEVNYGTENFRAAELSKLYVLGFEHTFSNGLQLRLEGYYKDISLPTLNYQNLRDQWEVFPEVRNDVVQLDISRARSRGVELFLKYDIGRSISWWFTYSLAKAEENINDIEYFGLLENKRGWLPKSNNQDHTLYFDLNYRFSDNWIFNLSWQFWSGWPLTIYEYGFEELENGEIHFYPIHKEFRGEKFPDYHRLDLRINYHFNFSLGRLSTYLHLINLYNKENLRKFDIDVTNSEEKLVPDAMGGYNYFRDDKYWFGLTPVIGINWEF